MTNYCKLCGKDGSQVTIIHGKREYSQLVPGYCLSCQEWLFMFFIMIIFGLSLIVVGLIRWEISAILFGAASFVLGVSGNGIVGFFYARGKK